MRRPMFVCGGRGGEGEWGVCGGAALATVSVSGGGEPPKRGCCPRAGGVRRAHARGHACPGRPLLAFSFA